MNGDQEDPAIAKLLVFLRDQVNTDFRFSDVPRCC